MSVPSVILACASPLASLDLSGSGQRERVGELQLMIEPHWFLFVHNKVFMLQITEIIGRRPKDAVTIFIYFRDSVLVSYIYLW